MQLDVLLPTLEGFTGQCGNLSKKTSVTIDVDLSFLVYREFNVVKIVVKKTAT